MTKPTFTFKRAERTVVKAKILITGPSSSGKTRGALALAEAIAPGKIALIDSENDRSGYYADAVAFDVLSIPNALPKTYVAAMEAAVDAGYEVVIIDSLSHAWQNVLDRKTDFDSKQERPNSYMSWRIFGSEWDELVRKILELPIHVIATGRSKQDYEQITKPDGKKEVVKLGMAPQIREGTDYEFAFHFDLTEKHRVQVRKDNSEQFGDVRATYDLLDGSISDPLVKWLGTAKPVEQPEPETVAAIDAAIALLPEAKQAPVRKRFASLRIKGLSDAKAQEMLSAIKGMPEYPKAEAAEVVADTGVTA